MCLFPGGGMVCPPCAEAKTWGTRVTILLVLHFLVAITNLLASQWMNGFIDIILIAIGFSIIRNPQAYSLQPALCFTLVAGFSFFSATLRLITLYAVEPSSSLSDAGPTTLTSSIPREGWQSIMYQIATVGGPFVLFFEVICGYKLYNLLKDTLERELNSSSTMRGVAVVGGGGVSGAPVRQQTNQYGYTGGGGAIGGSSIRRDPTSW